MFRIWVFVGVWRVGVWRRHATSLELNINGHILFIDGGMSTMAWIDFESPTAFARIACPLRAGAPGLDRPGRAAAPRRAWVKTLGLSRGAHFTRDSAGRPASRAPLERIRVIQIWLEDTGNDEFWQRIPTVHGKNKTPFWGMPYLVWVWNQNRRSYVFWLFFEIVLCSAISFERSRQELSIDVAEHRYILRNKGLMRILVIFQDRPMFSRII